VAPRTMAWVWYSILLRVSQVVEGSLGACAAYRAWLTCARTLLAVTSLHASGDDTSYHMGVACACFSPGIDVAWEEMNMQRVCCKVQASKKS
jgi:hypothetical protein